MAGKINILNVRKPYSVPNKFEIIQPDTRKYNKQL
jgi:hypothetical protein